MDHPDFLEKFLALVDGAVADDGRVLAVVDEGDEFFEGVGDLAQEPEVHVVTEELGVFDFDEIGEFGEEFLGTQHVEEEFLVLVAEFVDPEPVLFHLVDHFEFALFEERFVSFFDRFVSFL